MMIKHIITVVEAPEITVTEDDNAGDILLNFFRALGWNGDDYLDPSKIRTTKEVYDQLYDLTLKKCSDPVSVGMHMVNSGPGVENYIPTGQVWLYEGWTKPYEPEEGETYGEAV